MRILEGLQRKGPPRQKAIIETVFIGEEAAVRLLLHSGVAPGHFLWDRAKELGQAG